MRKDSSNVAREVELQERRRERRRHRYDAGELRQAERQADQANDQDADQCGTVNLSGVQCHDQDEAQQAQQRCRHVEIAERHQRGRMVDDDAGILERDDAEEQSDAGADRVFQVSRDRVDDVFAQSRHRQEEEQHAGQKHRAERLLPRVFVCQHHGEGEERVQSHAGRERDRIIRVQPHHDAAHRRGDAGGDEYGALVHSRLRENARIDEDDVGHRQERGQTGQRLGLHVGAVGRQAEIPVEKIVCTRGLAGRLFIRGHVSPPACPVATGKTSASPTSFAVDCDVVHRKKSQTHAKPA